MPVHPARSKPGLCQRKHQAQREAQRVGWLRVLGGIRSVVSLFGYACLKWFLVQYQGTFSDRAKYGKTGC